MSTYNQFQFTTTKREILKEAKTFGTIVAKILIAGAPLLVLIRIAA